jgi:hypothetical protein
LESAAAIQPSVDQQTYTVPRKRRSWAKASRLDPYDEERLWFWSNNLSSLFYVLP